MQLFDQQVYSNRRAVLRQRINSDIILLPGNLDSSMNYKDNCYPFRQDSTFLYYFGLDIAGLAAVIDTATGDEIIFGNDLTMDDIIWTGILPSVKEMAAEVGVSKTQPYPQIAAYLQKQITLGRRIHILPPYRPENKILLAEWLQTPLQMLNGKVSEELIRAVVSQRAIKEGREIEEMEKAVNISVDMHLAVMQYAQPGMKEYELVAKVQEIALAADGRLSYPAIITVKGQTLHTHDYSHTLQEGQMVLCDAGAENNRHYAGDLTRTFPVGKHFTSQQKELYHVVLASMDHAISLLKPGVTYKEIHLQASQKLMEGLKEVGLTKGDPAEAVAAGAHTLFFQCGLGHMIGMDVHDMEDLGESYVGYTDTLKKSTAFGLKSLRLGRGLEEGYVLTVEPGIYMIPELIDRFQADNKYHDFINYDLLNAAYRDFTGIRIEDNFLITNNGYKLLGKYLPKSLEEIEALRG